MVAKLKWIALVSVFLVCHAYGGSGDVFSKYFKLNPDSVERLETQAFLGNGDAAAKLARHYCYVPGAQGNLLKGYFWYYLAELLQHYRAGIALTSVLIDEGNVPPIDNSNIIDKFSGKIEELSERSDIFSNLIVYHFFLKKGNSAKAEPFYRKLEGKVDGRLLASYKDMFENRPPGCLDRGFLLDEDEIPACQELALMGDAERAFDLYLHYRFSHACENHRQEEKSRELACLFLYIASILNSEEAAEHLFFLKDQTPAFIFDSLSDKKQGVVPELQFFIDYLNALYAGEPVNEELKSQIAMANIAPCLLKKYRLGENRLSEIE